MHSICPNDQWHLLQLLQCYTLGGCHLPHAGIGYITRCCGSFTSSSRDCIGLHDNDSLRAHRAQQWVYTCGAWGQPQVQHIHGLTGLLAMACC